MLEAMGFTHDALALLQHKGWDALLRARRQARRAHLRLPWRLTKGPAGSQGAMPAVSAQQRAAAQAGAGLADLEEDEAGAGGAGALDEAEQAQQGLEAVLVVEEPATAASAAGVAEPSAQPAAALPAWQQGGARLLRQSQEHDHPPRQPEPRRLASQPSTVQHLLRRVSMLSASSLPPELGPCPSARGPLVVAGAATPLDALSGGVHGADRQTDGACP